MLLLPFVTFLCYCHICWSLAGHRRVRGNEFKRLQICFPPPLFTWWWQLLDYSLQPLHGFSVLVPGLSLNVYQSLRAECPLCTSSLPSGIVIWPSTTTMSTGVCQVPDCVCGTCLCPSPILSALLLWYTHFHMSQCISLSDLFVCCTRNPWLNYSCPTCNHKGRDQKVFSCYHDAHVLFHQRFISKSLERTNTRGTQPPWIVIFFSPEYLEGWETEEDCYATNLFVPGLLVLCAGWFLPTSKVKAMVIRTHGRDQWCC